VEPLGLRQFPGVADGHLADPGLIGGCPWWILVEVVLAQALPAIQFDMQDNEHRVPPEE